MYQFRDPIHGFINVSDDELKIINSAPFQRLRNIRQLGTTYLVYHGAEHTRFGHSIGVMHLVSRTFDSVTHKNKHLFSDNQEENKHKTAWYRQLLRLIGLTHDLGHAPFSHASEELFADGVEHEDLTKRIILETEIADYIREIGAKFKQEHGAIYDITPELVWMIYEGKQVTDERFILPDFFFLQSFVDGELDCDKMDYLLRDSLYCGVSYGRYDLDRFISTLTAYKDGNVLKLAIERGGVQALEEFILARYFMFIQVYFHKTRRYLDKALVKCLSAILPEGKYPTDAVDDIEEYLKWNDSKVLSIIAESQSPDVVAFKQRKIMTCIRESPPHTVNADKILANSIFNSLQEKFVDKVILDKVDKSAHGLIPTIFEHEDDSGKSILILGKNDKPINIMDESIILKSIAQPISIQRIYAEKDIAEEAEKLIQSLTK